jgi:lipoate-protein ligase A
MAVDHALLDRAEQTGERWLRLYTWSPHCLSFGRHEPAARRYDRDRIERAGLDVVRRPTGGRAVWHARELTYAVAAPVAAMGGLRAAYLGFHRVLLAVLRRLGADASLAAAFQVPALEAGACFASAVGGEIMVKGRKVVGSAQVRQGTAVLQHGSILLGDDQAIVGTVTRGEPPADGSGPLSAALGRTITAGEMAGAVLGSVREMWRGDRLESGSFPALLSEAGAYLGRYQSAEWTWRA